jgi:Ser/Thr protein kinase RdoA (MazF antagonist)
MDDLVLSAYGFPSDTTVTPHGSGLINRTWIIHAGKETYILQQLNGQVFSRPALIADNIEMVGQYLSDHYPRAIFPRPVRSVNDETMVDAGPRGHYRLYPFIKNSVTIDVAHSPQQAFEAARQFGGFTHMLAGFPAERLHETLPHFHDLSLRYRAFNEAVKAGIPERIRQAQELIRFLSAQKRIVTEYENILTNPAFKRRVTHHDTKISNVLFDKQGKGICVIDLDTVMPGYFISDVGDMLRTYLSPVTEEEGDISRIRVRVEYFEAIVQGYLEEMHHDLTPDEKDAFVYAGEFMLYMQALRFLTDFISGDKYYGSRYEGHNYIRALNQITLLQRFQDLAPALKAIASRVMVSL